MSESYCCKRQVIYKCREVIVEDARLFINTGKLSLQNVICF
jgi:hypothetical protein